MTDFQAYMLSFTTVAVFALTIVYKTAIYAIMRATSKVVEERQRDQ